MLAASAARALIFVVAVFLAISPAAILTGVILQLKHIVCGSLEDTLGVYFAITVLAFAMAFEREIRRLFEE